MNKPMRNVKAAEDYVWETSRKDLAAGVLKQVAADLRRFPGATSVGEWEFYLDAYCWLTTDDSSWPFSFLNVCHLLNLSPETVREKLVGDMSKTHWTPTQWVCREPGIDLWRETSELLNKRRPTCEQKARSSVP